MTRPIYAFTDASVPNHHTASPGQAAYGICFYEEQNYNTSGKIPNCTNSSDAEWIAIQHAIKRANQLDPNMTRALLVYSDSMNAVSLGKSQGQAVAGTRAVTFTHETNHPGIAVAHKLAGEAARN